MRADDMIGRAVRLADEVLFPAALTVDRADRVPESLIQLLIENGFYGSTPSVSTVEALASGSLATAFVWLQHHGPMAAAARSEQPGIRETWLAPLAGGELRGGIARAGARRGGLRVRRADGGYQLKGMVPWVSGWDLIDVVHVAAVDGDTVRFLMMDAKAAPTLRAEWQDLVAARASRTVTLTFDDHFVPADRFTGSVSYDEWQRGEAPGSALNGALALGVATRCRKLLGDAVPGLREEIDAAREALATADPQTTPAARARASRLAMRAATALMVHTGSRSVLIADPAQMLLREAGFLLVFGTRPLIRQALLDGLSG